MRFTLVALALLVLGTLASAQTLDLLAPPQQWAANVDNPAGTQMTLAPTAEAPLTTKIVSNGDQEDYPKLRLEWQQGQNFSTYTRLRYRVRVTSPDPSVRQRRLAVVFYDNAKRHAEMEGNPMWQQGLNHVIPVGKWIEFSDWLTSIQRGQIMMIDLYLYEDSGKPVEQQWEFSKVQLEGVGDVSQVFDGEVYGKDGLATTTGQTVGQVETTDFLSLMLDKTGGVAQLLKGDAPLGRGDTCATGLMVRDVNTTEAPVKCGGKILKRGDRLLQTATLEKLGLSVEATYRSLGDYIEVNGKVADLRGEDRAVTVYFAVPVGRVPGDWQWWDSVATARVKSEVGELSYLEGGNGFGLRGEHSKYPLGTISNPAGDALTLAVRMDEPVVHRIGYNPGLKVLYLALDFGLTPMKTIKGKSLSEAPFRFLLYHSDPALGMRGALQRYYDFFPEFFTDRVPRKGGWLVWGDARDTKGVLEAGFGCHWGPAEKAVKWDNDNGLLSLLYIEPEFYQETMGDYNECPSVEAGLARLAKIAAGNPEETAKYGKLGYAHSYVPASWVKEHSFEAATQAVATACVASVNHESDGTPTGSPGKFPWMNESQYGIIFPCSLDPDIPGGKGQFCRDLYIEPGLKQIAQFEGHYDGIALDSFGGYGQTSRANYRRELFQYTDAPLCFSWLDHAPVLAMPWSSVKWVRKLATDMHARKLVLMANCSWGTTPGWLTFAAPYLDIFGAEAKEFADPDFIRAIARNKLCTDLPYEPVPDWQLQRNQLWGIFPGHGNKPEYMAQFAQTFRDLAAARWEPVTRASATPATVKIERYGNTLVLHNPTKEAVEAKVTVDTAALKVKEGTLVVPLEAQGTVLVKLQ